MRRDLPNQDAVLWAPRNGAERHFIAAVADGHGAPEHFRSEAGARLAVEAAVSALERFRSEQAPDQLMPDLASEIVATWRQAVRAHANQNPAASDWVEPDDDKLIPYGSTLLVTAFTQEMAVAVQIGDGDLYWAYPDGRIERPLPDDMGLKGEETYSLCMAEAEKHARVKLARTAAGETLPCFAMLSTDGVAKSFEDEAAFQDIVRHYHQAMMTAAPKTVLDGLPGWLEAVSRGGSGDDTTICLAVQKAPSA